MARENFYRKKSKYNLYTTYIEISTWDRWILYSIREKKDSVSAVLKNTKTKKRKAILLEKISNVFKPLIRR